MAKSKNKKNHHKPAASIMPVRVERRAEMTAAATGSAGAEPVAPDQPTATPAAAGNVSTGRESATGTLQQHRARFALERVTILARELNQEEQKKFSSYASAMPFMVHANGLGQTAAFYRRKGTQDMYYRLYKLLGDWLGQPRQPFDGKDDLLEGITRSDMTTYLLAQAEAMLFLNWVKQFANAFMAGE